MAISTKTTKVFYSDLRSDLAVNPATDDVMVNTNEAAIEQSIKNLLQTNFYERLFQPTVGSNIRSLLFELATPQTSYNLKEAVFEVIENYEPRCQIIDVIVENDIDRHSLNVYIEYRAINIDGIRSFTTVLSRVR
jgi:phage baseplate assembly protein W